MDLIRCFFQSSYRGTMPSGLGDCTPKHVEEWPMPMPSYDHRQADRRGGDEIETSADLVR